MEAAVGEVVPDDDEEEAVELGRMGDGEKKREIIGC